MTIFVDHAFIMCDVGAPEAEALLDRGFVEGSANVHTGQGTANRRFFFENFMIELLWVTDPLAVGSEAVRITALLERWSARDDGASRFGVVFGGTTCAGTSPPFETRSYFPPYLPPGQAIEVIQGLTREEPVLFWMPWLESDRLRSSEPVEHAIPLRRFSGFAFGLPRIDMLSPVARQVSEAGLLKFRRSDSMKLEIHFLANLECHIDLQPELPLVFYGHSQVE